MASPVGCRSDRLGFGSGGLVYRSNRRLIYLWRRRLLGLLFFAISSVLVSHAEQIATDHQALPSDGAGVSFIDLPQSAT
jgi:hypothetical protein